MFHFEVILKEFRIGSRLKLTALGNRSHCLATVDRILKICKTPNRN